MSDVDLFEDFIFTDRLTKQLKLLVEKPEILRLRPILCFHGFPGVGKTSFGKKLMSHFCDDYQYFPMNERSLRNNSPLLYPVCCETTVSPSSPYPRFRAISIGLLVIRLTVETSGRPIASIPSMTSISSHSPASSRVFFGALRACPQPFSRPSSQMISKCFTHVSGFDIWPQGLQISKCPVVPRKSECVQKFVIE